MIQLVKNDYSKTTGVILLVTQITYFLESILGYKSIGFLYLAAIFYQSTFIKKNALIFSAFLSTFFWNFFFIPPKYTFTIRTQEDLMMVFSYFFAAIVGGILATRIKKQEEELHKLNLKSESKKLHDIILNSVSHEMKTPLTVLIGSATALNDSAIFDNKGSREMLTKEIVSSANRLNRVVENLLDMSRLERNDLVLKKEWFSWEDLFNELKIFLGEDLKKCQLTCEGDISDIIEADFSLLLHVFANLISNSIKHSTADIEIKISITKASNNYKILFKDTGPGISVENFEKIFEKFYTSPSSKAGGLGLGLAIVRNIIELHRGEISPLECDVGALFVIIFPKSTPKFNLAEVYNDK